MVRSLVVGVCVAASLVAPRFAAVVSAQSFAAGPAATADVVRLTSADIQRAVTSVGRISFARDARGQQPDATTINSAGSRILINSLYVTTAVVQALDAHSTFKAIDAGAVETNPLAKPFSNNRGAFVALKAGMAAGIIYAGHGLYKRNKVAGVLALVGVNVAYGFIVANNYHVASEQRVRSGQ
jgi:hypothetical protein